MVRTLVLEVLGGARSRIVKVASLDLGFAEQGCFGDLLEGGVRVAYVLSELQRFPDLGAVEASAEVGHQEW